MNIATDEFRNGLDRTNYASSGRRHIFRVAFALLLLATMGILGAAAAGAAGTPGTSLLSPQFSLSPASLNFGSVTVGQSATLKAGITNNSKATHKITSGGISGAAFSLVGATFPISIAAGKTAAIQVKFAPLSPVEVPGTLTLDADVSGLSISVPLSGQGVEGDLSASPASVNLGNVAVGQSVSQNVIVDNTGNATVHISSVTVSGAGFSASGLAKSQAITAGASATLTVSFKASNLGEVSGSVAIASDAANSPLTVVVSATGIPAPVPQLTLSPAGVSFGSVIVGSSAKQTVSITNTGTANLTVTSSSVSGAGFTITGLSLPVTLTPNQSTSFSAAFAPQSAGYLTGSVTLISNDPASPSILPFSGTGVAQVLTLSATPGSLSFGTVNVGQSSTLSFALTNTGNASVTISSVSASGTGFSETGITAPLSLAPSQSATVSVVFAPLVAGSDSGSVSVVSNATNSPLSIPLSGTAGAPQLGASPASVSFGNVVVGSSGQQTITLTNLGSANLNISSSSVSGTGFTITGLSLPLTLSPSQSTSFSTVFTPLAAGAVTGSISLVSNDPASPMNLPLSGTAVAQTLTLSANPTSLSFGNVNVGLTGTLPFVVTNTGNASVVISSVSASGTGFSETGITAPLTLAANQSATVSVVFTPLAAGSDTGSVSVVSNATNSPLTVSLSGTAVAQTLTLNANPTSLAFGNVNVGQTGTLPFVVTNTGNASVIISSVSASGTGFSESGITAPLTLAANQSATVSVVFTPLAAGSDTGSVSVVSNATNSPLTVSLSGTAVGQTLTLSANPTSLAFGNVNVGQTGTLSFGVMNTGNASVVISSVSASGTGFSESGITAPLTLAANQSAMVNVIFAPTAAGSDTGSVSVVSNATNSPLTVSLSGTAVGQTLTLGASPTNLAFGNVTVGQTSTLNFVVTNTGNASVTVSSVSASGAGFSETGITAPLVLSANQSATVSVAFTPSAAGEVSGSVSVTSNATNSPLTVSLSGTGVTQVQHTADLTWTASQGGDIAGYNVYRATESEGPFTKINPALVVATSYTDQTVQPKTTYYFVVTAVDNEGNESPYGNEVIVEVP